MNEGAQRVHHTYPVATAALGRLLTGAAIMGAAGLKNETDSMTVQIKGEVKLQTLLPLRIVTVGSRGYVSNPYVDRPLNNKGKLDVGGAIGGGYLSVVRDLGLKRAVCRTNSACIGRNCGGFDILLCKSEQIPTSVCTWRAC